MMLRRSISVLCVSRWRTCLRLRKVNVIDRELLRGMPTVRTILNQCVEYNILFDCAFIVSLIIKSRCVVYVERLEGIHLISFFSCMENFHYVYHGYNGVPVVYEMLCKFWFSIFVFKISEMLLKSCVKRPVGLSILFFYYSLGILAGKHHIDCIYWNWYFYCGLRIFL
jgi:hypothetical protein